MPIERFRTFADLIAFLVENNVPHRAAPDKLAVEIQVGDPARVGTVHVRWDRDLPLVQVVFPFVGEVPAARLADIETAICRVNNTVKLPGFGIEYEHFYVYMRLAVPLAEDGIAAHLFQRQVLAIIENANQLVGAFRDVIAGAPGKDVLDLALKHKQAK